MARLRLTVLAGLLASLVAVGPGAAPASADVLQPFFAVLNGATEVPTTTDSTAVGSALLTYQDTLHELCWRVSHNVAGETAAHIHGPATPEEAAGVLINLGTGNPKVGCAIITNEQRRFLRTGLLYINIHSGAFAAGEIRGQIFPVRGITYGTD